MAPVTPSPPGFSPEPTISTTDPTPIEEGKITPSSQASTVAIAVSTINAPKIIAEMVGTYVIILMGCGSIVMKSDLSPVGIAVSWGLSIMVMIYALGHVSGGHFNPAITIAFAASYKFPWKEVPGYVGSQLAGSILAILTLKEMTHSDTVDFKATVTQYDDQIGPLKAIIWEFIISFILMLSICGVATDKRAINELSGVAVGTTMMFNVMIAGNITGASMNPARSLAAALVSRNFRCLWVYLVAPVLGTVAASSTYCLLWLPTSEDVDKESTKSV